MAASFTIRGRVYGITPYNHGTPFTTTHTFGNKVEWSTPAPAHFGNFEVNAITNPVQWTPSPSHFGNPSQAVTVTLTLTGTSGGSTTTDSFGDYSFTGLTAGTYTITPTAAGYTFAQKSYTITITDSVNGIDFTSQGKSGGGVVTPIPAPLNFTTFSTLPADVGNKTSSAIDTTGSSLLIFGIMTINPSGAIGINSISDSKSNTWTPLTVYGNGSLDNVQLYYVSSPTVGTNHTVTVSLNGSSFRSMLFGGFSNITTALPFDQQNGNSSSSATVSSIQPGSITPTANGELILAMDGNLGSGVTIDSGFTIVTSIPFVASVTAGIDLYYLVKTTAAAINPTVSYSTPSNGAAVTIASFKHA